MGWMVLGTLPAHDSGCLHQLYTIRCVPTFLEAHRMHRCRCRVQVRHVQIVRGAEGGPRCIQDNDQDRCTLGLVFLFGSSGKHHVAEPDTSPPGPWLQLCFSLLPKEAGGPAVSPQ